MNLKNSIVLFLILISIHFFGEKTVVLSFYENNYIINFMEITVLLLCIFFGITTLIKIYKKYTKLKK
jgi:hypothetical protein